MKILGKLLMACWLGLPLGLLVPGGGAEQHFPEATMSVGQKHFVRYCSSCHGVDGRGHGPVALALRLPPPDLTRLRERHGGTFPDAEITSQIDGRAGIRAHGSRDMPVWGRRFGEKYGEDSLCEEFVRGHLLVLVDYLRSIQE
jgi:mono/diheme cytochrome c family protein